jgi:hypothetical protein
MLLLLRKSGWSTHDVVMLLQMLELLDLGHAFTISDTDLNGQLHAWPKKLGSCLSVYLFLFARTGFLTSGWQMLRCR